MKKVLVAGGVEDAWPGAEEFAKLLGAQIASEGHVLINGCQTSFDKFAAQGAYDQLREGGIDPKERIKSYVLSGKQPIHNFGTVLRSQLSNWNLDGLDLYIPEPIKIADAVILVGGWEGTARAANWARIANKPILPVTAFGGMAADIYKEEIKLVQGGKYEGRIEPSHFEVLNQVPGESEWKNLAHDVVSLAERITSSRRVFIIMSFTEKPIFKDALATFQEICKEFQYEANRIDQQNDMGRIIPGIFAGIKRSAFVIVDLSESKPNVYYELGYAQGLDKPVIVTAYKGTELPFDVTDIPTIFWESQVDFKEKLRSQIEDIASQQGREFS